MSLGLGNYIAISQVAVGLGVTAYSLCSKSEKSQRNALAGIAYAILAAKHVLPPVIVPTSHSILPANMESPAIPALRNVPTNMCAVNVNSVVNKTFPAIEMNKTASNFTWAVKQENLPTPDSNLKFGYTFAK